MTLARYLKIIFGKLTKKESSKCYTYKSLGCEYADGQLCNHSKCEIDYKNSFLTEGEYQRYVGNQRNRRENVEIQKLKGLLS